MAGIMPDETLQDDPPTLLERLSAMQADAARQLFAGALPDSPATMPTPADAQRWAMVAGKHNKMWLE